MSDINLQLVREFFELNVFRVLTNWQQDAWPARSGEPGSQLFVENAGPVTSGEPDFVLHPHYIGRVERALVEVRAWHGDRFYPSVIEASPVLSQFVEEDSLAYARDLFGGRPFDTILVVSELPTGAEPRARSINLLREAGIGYVLEFPAILQDLLDRVSINGTYTGSPTLQTLRLLKRYRLVRHQQMEFAFRAEAAAAVPPTAGAPVDTEEE